MTSCAGSQSLSSHRRCFTEPATNEASDSMPSQEEEQQQQKQGRRQPTAEDRPGDDGGAGAVRYGDVFAGVEGELATTPVAPRDAAMMQAAEHAVLGHAPRGGTAASVMQSAVRRNERLGVVPRDEDTDAGIAVSEARVPGFRVVTEFVGDQAVGQQYTAAEEEEEDTSGGATATATAASQAGGVGQEHGHGVVDGTKITIGEALEAAAFSAGDQPVEASDAAAIEAAEARAARLDLDEARAPPGGLAAQARAAADANAQAGREGHADDRTTLRQVLADATVRLGADKEVEREDAARVVGAEVRGDPDAAARPGGVGASIAAAARLNRGRQ